MRDTVQKQAVETVHKADFNALIFAATGIGKTKIGFDCIKLYLSLNPGSKFLWLVPTTRLRDHTVPQEKEKWAPDVELDILCYASIQKADIESYDIIVADECHHITPRVYEYLKKKKNFIGLSATPPEEEERIEILDSLSNDKFIYTLDEAVEAQVVDDYEVVIIKLRLDNSIKYIEAGNKKNRFKVTEKKQYEYCDSQVRKAQYSITSIRSMKKAAMRKGNIAKAKAYDKKIASQEYLVKRFSSMRMNALYTFKYKIACSSKIIEKLYTDKERVLILSQRIAVAEELHPHVFHSKDKSGLEKFESGETNMLSACNALDEGENLGKLDSVFIQQVRSKGRQLVQRIGRSIRKSDKEKAMIYIMCYAWSQDEKWVNNAVKGLKSVKTVTYEDFIKELDERRN